jgi:hypothetical protein
VEKLITLWPTAGSKSAFTGSPLEAAMEKFPERRFMADSVEKLSLKRVDTSPFAKGYRMRG